MKSAFFSANNILSVFESAFVRNDASMLRKLVKVLVKCGGRKHRIAVLLLWTATSLLALSWLHEDTMKALSTPPPPDQNLSHYRRNRNLEYYLDNINILVEPSSDCKELPQHSSMLILVSSAPHHAAHRAAIRETWGKFQPTFFVMGIKSDDSLVDNYVEAKHHRDLIIFDLIDHYQNLTLKTALMLEWTSRRCPGVGYLFKTDDDVVVNPFTMAEVVRDHGSAALIGYSKNNSHLHRDEYNKWYVPRWLYNEDVIPQYLSGTGYLIKEEYIPKILQAGKRTPLMNLEDVYLTHLVSKSNLKLDLVHDHRLSPYKPWIGYNCVFWSLASLHSFSPLGIRHAWRIIEGLANERSDVCDFYKKYLETEWFLY